jgi:hypothetical protein
MSNKDQLTGRRAGDDDDDDWDGESDDDFTGPAMGARERIFPRNKKKRQKKGGAAKKSKTSVPTSKGATKEKKSTGSGQEEKKDESDSGSETEIENLEPIVRNGGGSIRKIRRQLYAESAKQYESEEERERARREELRKDPDYDGKEEDNNDEASEASGVEQEARVQQRYRAVRDLDSDCMSRDSNGMIAISKFSYNPEKKVKVDNVRQILGSRANTLTEEEIEEIIAWFRQLKVNAGAFCRERILAEVMNNARKEKVGYSSLRDIRDAWARASTNEELETMGKLIDKLLREGYFQDCVGFRDTSWKYKLEKELMEKFELAYLPEEEEYKELGCMARQASRSMSDVRKSLLKKGRRVHGKIVTKRRPTRKNKGESYNRKDKASKEFVPSYVRESEKLNTAPKKEGSARTRKSGPKKLFDMNSVRSGRSGFELFL